MCPAPDNNIAALLSLVKPPIADKLVPETNAELFDRQSTEQWIETLSTTNFAINAIQLYRVLPSVTQLDNQPQIKMEILDSLMPTVLKSIEALVQNQLNQDTAKAISLGQALAKRLFEGYKLVIFQLGHTLKSESENNREEEAASQQNPTEQSQPLPATTGLFLARTSHALFACRTAWSSQQRSFK